MKNIIRWTLAILLSPFFFVLALCFDTYAIFTGRRLLWREAWQSWVSFEWLKDEDHDWL